MDFIEQLPSSNGYIVIMVIVDRLSKYAHFVALKHPYTAVTIAKAFITNVVRLHGIPTAIVSDRDKVFTDGQTEVVNRTLEQYLRCFASDQPRKWVEWIPWAKFSYNTSIHSATKMTPFEAVYGIPPPHLVTYVPGTSRVQAVDEYLRDRDTILRELRHNLSLARQRMKSHTDLKRWEVSFEVGDYVYLKLQPYRQTSVAFRASMKLAPRFFGPYYIIGKVGTVAYRLALPPSSQIHNVFHVSMLRKHLGPIHTSASNQLPHVSDDFTILPQPKAILDRRVIQKGKYHPKFEILVKWRGAPNEDAT
ncbi:Integrase catalytic domain-containing protein [Citrus sinensis]|uniref:Integrase catalytic domain-containing protein n=1 Tax=Citrus sinensis TaxID=2711 RepID=A0ACB8LBW4_CITSI|nr:Integrase catalytic domain-containing protein [Citrus sinensis]